PPVYVLHNTLPRSAKVLTILSALRLVREHYTEPHHAIRARIDRRRPPLEQLAQDERRERPGRRPAAESRRRTERNGGGRVLRPAAPVSSRRQPGSDDRWTLVRPAPAVRTLELLRRHGPSVLPAEA